MKTGKLWNTLLAALLMVALLAGCGCQAAIPQRDAEGGEGDAALTGTEDSSPAPAEPAVLHVGNPTVTKGDFFSDLFGNNTADIDVRALIHGYNLVNWDQEQGEYVIDPSVVKSWQVTTDEAGNKTYHFVLCDDLRYSDGTAITAWDYAFSWLLKISPEIEQIGGNTYHADRLLGFADYVSGTSSALQGVHVIDEREFEVTLDHEFLPYFYEVGLLICVPYPISVIAPGCKVYDDGDGIYLADEADKASRSVFSAELLRRTLLDPETGYNSHPSVCSGPYVLESYDGVTCRFTRNPYFKGAWAGEAYPFLAPEEAIVTAGSGYLVKPSIEKIEYTVADLNTLAEDFKDGTFQLVNKVSYAPVIAELEKSDELRNDSYPRVGLSFVTFSYEMPTVSDKAVRQAVAWCMDRDQLTHDYCGDNGMRVDGYYGMEQWEYLMVSGKMAPPVRQLEEGETIPENQQGFKNLYARSEQEYKAMRKAWRALTLDGLEQYSVNLDKANQLLNRAGWTLNSEGKNWQAGLNQIRCKKIDGELVSLDLKLMVPEGNHIVDTMQQNWIDNLNACGIGLTIVPTPMQDLLDSFHRETERTTDMIYLATNFQTVEDPSVAYSADPSEGHVQWNNIYSDDEKLYELALAMRKTEPGDVYSYVSKWVDFQKRYNDVLPAIPVYSNYYYDFYVPQLEGYNVTSHVTWSQAILSSTLTPAG